MMTLALLKEHLEATPFRPFAIRTVSGRTVQVEHPEYVWIPPKSRGDFLLVEMSGTKHHLAIECVEAFEVKSRGKKTIRA